MNLPTDYQFLYGKPVSRAIIRHTPEDFRVSEIPSFLPEGEGEHVFLLIRKTGENTDWVARQLAGFCQIPVNDVGYAGKKDRHAVTEQWFSVKLPINRQMTWSLFGGETIQVLKAERHLRKLRLGSLLGNRFSLRLRNVTDEQSFIERIDMIKSGVPNYFGEQRFGFDGGNLAKGVALLKGEFKERQRHKKGLYISAVRSWLFNHCVSERIRQNLWNTILPGDAMVLSGSKSHFVAEALDEVLPERLAKGDVHLSAPLWGRGRLQSTDEAAEWESKTVEPWDEITERLAYVGLQQERRSMRLIPDGLQAEKEADGTWLLNFSLPAGAFATSVLRELCDFSQEGPEPQP
ncbi:tRNA pseudouridine(13) synthase TruD [Neptunomonas concharum]|uniref:tRNA pseudouridine synthase D n=1 Tax=Neptunomonas concharum TaxID=1031538 RepID=A0A5P1R7X1_9GAMM|nr:tRNA pseudouridine(13) synthase TruD [Neptunomonas concharum]QEQ95734.1 tRNA pseudouridine(13) synthase TruD [Neptunomonas concharum]